MEKSRTSITMPGAPSPTVLPDGWTILRSGDLLTVAGPEADLQLSFLARPITDDLAGLVYSAWRELTPGFDIPILQKVEIPAKDGWDSEMQIAYDVPESESRIVFAIARVLGGLACITLIDGSRAGFGRRSAQFSELHSAWRPAGFKELSLANLSPKTFGHEERDAMSHFVSWAMEQLGIPGLALAIVQKDQTVYAEGFGVCNTGLEQRVTPDTRFMIGSATKPLTTMMMARLVDLGYFTWSTPVTCLLPAFSLKDEELTRRLEIQHTVSASTGMPREGLKLVFRFRGLRPEDRIAEMRQMSPTTGFGETFQYSNYLVAAGGYAAAHSYAQELDLNSAYEHAMQELVFKPLGMTHTSVLTTHSPLDAAPHSRNPSGLAAPIDPVLETFAHSVAPAGSLWSNVVDMAQVLKCEMLNGLNDRGERILSEENLLARRHPAIKVDRKTSYGLGWFLKDRQGLTEIGHGGNTRGFTSAMFFLPEQRIGMVILANLGLANQFLASVEQKLLDLLYGMGSKAEAMVAAEKKALTDAAAVMGERIKTDAASTAWISEYTGSYLSEDLGPARISHMEDGFQIDLESGSSKLGVEQSGTTRQIVLMTPPWTTRLQLTDDANTILVDGGQTKYRFVRT